MKLFAADADAVVVVVAPFVAPFVAAALQRWIS